MTDLSRSLLAAARDGLAPDAATSARVRARAAMRARHSARDGEQPRRDCGPAFELGEPAVHDHEHVLRRIFECGIADTERAQDAPHEREVRGVDFVERWYRVDSHAIDRVRESRHLSRTCQDRGESVTQKLHCQPTSNPHVVRTDVGAGA
jgi:hypothetical protein